MGSKYKLIFCTAIVVVVLLLAIILTIMHAINKKENYSTKLIRLLNEQENVTVQDIFSFSFERAYVLDDCYISGEGFAQRYNLNISINQVKSGVSENIQRIVFVDESGAFIYEFKCDSSEIVLLEKGVIIFPETLIKATSPLKEKPLTISFQGLDYYVQLGDSSVIDKIE